MAKKKYEAPQVLEEIRLEMESAILAASHVNEPIEEDVRVVSVGQDVESFNHEWTWEF